MLDMAMVRALCLVWPVEPLGDCIHCVWSVGRDGTFHCWGLDGGLSDVKRKGGGGGYLGEWERWVLEYTAQKTLF